MAKFLALLEVHDLKQHVTGATHVPSHGVTSQGSTLRGSVAVALRLCPMQGLK